MAVCLCKIGQPTEVIRAIPSTLSLFRTRYARAHRAYLRLMSVFCIGALFPLHAYSCSLFPTIGSDQEANPIFLPGSSTGERA